MQSPICEAIALGDFSAWAKQLLNEWSSEDLIRLSFESSVASFCNQSPKRRNVQIVILENGVSVKTGTSLLQGSNHELLILWVGQSFTKEDLAFAIENQVFGILENPKLSDKKTYDLLTRAQMASSEKNQAAHLLHSLKEVVLQMESKNQEKELVAEMKTGLGKVERLVLGPPKASASILPLAQSQGLGDVLLTLAELERTGTLWIRGSKSGEEGKVDFLQGKITYAETGAVQQLKAIYRMFCWSSPRFLFNRQDFEMSEKEELINIGMDLLVQEGNEQARRYHSIQKEIPPSELRVDFVPRSLTEKTVLTPRDFQTLIQVAEYHHVSDILDYSGDWDIDLYEGLISLKKSGHIKVMPPSSKAV